MTCKPLSNCLLALQLTLLLVVLGSGCTSTSSVDETAPPVTFEDATSAVSGFTYTAPEVPGDQFCGVAWFDYDNDGWLDFYVTNGKGSDDGLMRNNGDGTFTNVMDAAGIGDQNGSSGVVAADLDNDGDEDLVVLGDSAALVGLGREGTPSEKAIRVFANDGDGTFSDVTDESNVVIPNEAGTVMQPALGDIDNDGLLDLFVIAPSSMPLTGESLKRNHLFLNQGGLTFTDISADSGVDYGGGACVTSFSHFDDDGWIDLYTGDCNAGVPFEGGEPLFHIRPAPYRVFANNGDRTFTELEVGLPHPLPPTEQPFPPTDRGFWMSSTLGDYDNDGDFEIFATNMGDVGEPLYLGQTHGFFERTDGGEFGDFLSVEDEVGIAATAPEFGWGASFADFNNDRWEDLVFGGNFPIIGALDNPGYLFVNQHDKTFRHEALPVDLTGKYTAGLAVADYNNDGFVDVLIANAAYEEDASPTPTLLKNAGNDNNWITVRLIGTDSNRSAVGAIVRVASSGIQMTKEVRAGSSFLSQDSLWLTFGLGQQQNETIDVGVKWPSGLNETFEDVATQTIAVLTEGSSN